MDMVFATMFAALVAGNFFAEFVIRLTPDSRLRAFVFALSALLGVLQIPGSVWGQRYRGYKKFVGVGGFFWRFWWLPIAFLPILPESWPRLELFLTFVALQAIAIFIIQPTYTEWLSRLVPVSHRAWYFSRRAGLAVMWAAVIGFPASIFMDHMRGSNQGDLGLTITFLVGVGLAFVSFGYYLKMPDTQRGEEEKPAEGTTARSLLTPLQDKSIRRLLWFLAVFTVGQTIAAPFFFPYAREVLHLGLLHLQILGACMAVASLASAPLWGYLGEKYGNKPILFLSGILIFAGPLCWALTIPGYGVYNMVVLGIGHVAAGVAWTGVNSGQLNFVLSIAKPEYRAQILGLTQTVTAVVSGIAPLVAGYWLTNVAGDPPSREFYMILFIANSVIRIGAVLLLFGISDPNSFSIRGFLSQVAGIRPRGVLAMKDLQKAETSWEVQRAVRLLGESGMRFAEAEVMRLLTDPSPIVRRESAEALAKLGGPDAAKALRSLIEKQPHLVEEEVVDALGQLRDRHAVAPLIALLGSPSSALRRSSARALGRIRHREALPALMESASNPDDPELRRAAIQALRQIGDPVCEEVITGAVRDAYPSARVAAAEAIAEMKLTSAAVALRETLVGTPDETFAEIAYALGAVGTKEDLPLILKVAASLSSAVGRRRCLLAAAHILGVEREFYRFLTLDPVARDQAFLEMAKTDLGGVVQTAISLYHAHQESEALGELARVFSSDAISAIASAAPKEGFLLALAAIQNGD